MKHMTLLVALVLGSFSAIAAGYYDLDDELESASQLMEKADYKQAIEKLEDAIKSDSENVDAWNLLGYASRKKGDLEKSARAYKKALSLVADEGYRGEIAKNLVTREHRYHVFPDTIYIQMNLKR